MSRHSAINGAGAVTEMPEAVDDVLGIARLRDLHEDMFARDVSGLIRRSEALDSGASDADIRQALRSGALIIASRGLYAEASSLPEPGWERDQELYRRRCLEAGDATNGGPPLSHQSAAAVHGLAMLKPDTRRLHVSVPRLESGKRQPTRHVHPGLEDRDVVEVGGITVTNMATAAVQVAITSDFAGALTVFDSALRMGVSREELSEYLERRKRKGSVKARRALAFANGLSDNPGESWSRAQMIEGGLPVPTLQCKVVVGGRIYYSDYDWEGLLIGEFDGAGKYLNHRRPGESIGDAVMREKERENALRDIGFDVVRWDWPILQAKAVVERVGPRLRALGLI